MCGRFVVVYHGPHMAKALEMEREGEPLPGPRYNLAPCQHVPVVRQTAEGPRRDRGGTAAGDAAVGTDPLLAERPLDREQAGQPPRRDGSGETLLRSAFKVRRAVVSMSGFYEWQACAGGKVPHWIHPARGELLLAAGLWEEWRPTDAEPVRTFTILTTSANEFMGRLHERMPLFLAVTDATRWVDPETATAEVAELLRPGAEDLLVAHAVSTRVNSPRNDDSSLLQPVEPSAAPAGSLFGDVP